MGLYQVVLSFNMSNFLVFFEIDVKEFQHSNESSTAESSKNEDNFITLIFLASYGGVLTIFLITVSWKYYKFRKSAKRKGEVSVYLFVYYFSVLLVIPFL